MVLRASLALLGFVCMWRIASAQVIPAADPGAVQKHASETDQFYQLQKRINEERVAPTSDNLTNHLAPVPQGAGILTQQPTFTLRTVRINPSAIFPREALATLTRGYLGKQVTVADLNTIVASINELYKKNGYITAIAVLPPQRIVNGAVTIQLIEARLGKIVIKGNKDTRKSYFTDRIDVHAGDLIELKAIERSLGSFNAANDVKVRAVLLPGTQFGTTDLILEVQPSPVEMTSLSLDDAGLATTGRERVGTTETIKSLFGYRDPLSIGGYWSNGMWAGFGSYDVPLNASGLRIGPQVSYDNIRVRQSQLQKLAVNGSFYDLSVHLSQPLLTSDKSNVTIYAAPHFQESALQSQQQQISNIVVRSLELGATLQSSDKHGFWNGSLFTSVGDYSLLGLNAFVKFGGTATRYETWKHGVTGIFRAQGQGKAADPHSLPPSQQFQIGGLSTVRGYPEGALISDSGYSLTAELDTPLPLEKMKILGFPLAQRFQSAWFVDQGGIVNGSQSTYLTGIGGGLIVNLSRYFAGKVYLGTPLENRSQYKSVAVHFAIESNPSFSALFRKVGGNRE